MTFNSSISVIYSCISNLSIAVLSIYLTATYFPVAIYLALYTFPKDPSPKAWAASSLEKKSENFR